MILIRNAFQWHKIWSLRLAILTTLFASITAVYATLPPDWLPSIPQWLKGVFAYGAITTAALTGVARVVKQSNLAPPNGDGP